jgi:hypothetical protein
MKRINFLFIVIFTVFVSCKKDNDCQSSNLDIKSLESEYGCVNTKYGLSINLSDTYIIIRSQEEFENKVSGECIPNVDFSSYDLIIGKKQLTSGNSSIDYELIRDCHISKLELKVTYNQNIATEAPNLTYHALLPKLGDEETVEVQILIEY